MTASLVSQAEFEVELHYSVDPGQTGYVGTPDRNQEPIPDGIVLERADLRLDGRTIPLEIAALPDHIRDWLQREAEQHHEEGTDGN